MGSPAQSEAKPKFAVQRNAARTAILEAARRLALRDSGSAFSLATVAKEAGFVAATVYGYFRSKEELILAVIAEDLAALAALMRVGRSAEDSRAGVAADEDNVATAAQEKPAAESQATPTPVEATTAAVAVSPDVVDPQPEKGAAAVAEPEPQSTEPTNVVRASFSDDRPRVDAWLERRLRVFERALTDLERRMTESESRASTADSRSTDAAQTLLQRMDEFERQQNELQQKLAQRTEALERRQKGLSAEMRAGLNDASGRIERLELGKASMPRETGASPTMSEDDTKTDAELSSGDGIAIGRESRSEEDGYLAAARRAASAAAVLSDMHTGQPPEERSSWRRFVETRVRLSRKQNMLAGSATFLLFVIGAYAAFQIGHAGGREGRVAAVAHPAVAVAQRVSVAARKTAAATPLDRLSALAAAGDPRAELMIGLKYLHGDDVKADASRAFRWVEKAASAHEPLAQYWLGIMYQHGNGTPPDSVAALRWYEAAAGQGNCRAMHALGVAYAEGEGTGKDLAQAAHWFQRAAELGYVNSQFNLAVLYERGDGVPQSLGEAYKWYSIAAAQGDQESRTRVEALKSQLPQSDLQEAQLAAQQFHAASIDRQANVVPAMADLASSALISR